MPNSKASSAMFGVSVPCCPSPPPPPSYAHESLPRRFLMAAANSSATEYRHVKMDHSCGSSKTNGDEGSHGFRSNMQTKTATTAVVTSESRGSPRSPSVTPLPLPLPLRCAADAEAQDTEPLNAPASTASPAKGSARSSSSSRRRHRRRRRHVERHATPAAAVTAEMEKEGGGMTEKSDVAATSAHVSAKVKQQGEGAAGLPPPSDKTVVASSATPREDATSTVVSGTAATPSARRASKEVPQMPSVLEGFSVHSTSGFSFHSPSCMTALRVRDSDASGILGSITPSSNMTNTLSSRPGVNTHVERTPTLSYLPCPSRILSHYDGGTSLASEHSAVSSAAAPTTPAHAALSLLHLEADDSCSGRSSSSRTPLPCLPPRPRNSTTMCASINTSPIVFAVPPGDDAGDRTVHGSLPPATTSTTTFLALTPPPVDRMSTIVAAATAAAAAAAAAVRRSHGFNGSGNASDLRMALSGSVSNSMDVEHSSPGLLRLNMSGPRGRRRKSGVAVGSLTSATVGPCSLGSVCTPYGISLLLDGPQSQARCPRSSSSATAVSRTYASTANYFTGTNTWATNPSSASSQNTTLAGLSAMSPLLPRKSLTRPDSAVPVAATPDLLGAAALAPQPFLPPLLFASQRESAEEEKEATAAKVGDSPIDGTGVRQKEEECEEGENEEESRSNVHLTVPLTQSQTASDTRSKLTATSNRNSDSHASQRKSSTPRVKTPSTAPILVADVPSLSAVSQPSTPSASKPSSAPVKLVEAVLTALAPGTAVTSPVCERSASTSLTKQPPQREESEVRHRSTMLLLTCDNPSSHSASAGSMRSSLLLRADPLLGRTDNGSIGSSVEGNYHPTTAHHNGESRASSSTHSQVVNEYPHSPHSTSFRFFVPACTQGWSSDMSVDVPLDVCCTANTNVSCLTRKTDSPLRTMENSLTMEVSGLVTGEYPCLTSAMFRQLNSFSRSLVSASGVAGPRYGSVAVMNLASITNSAFIRATATAAAAAIMSSTTTTTAKTAAVTSAAAAPAVAATTTTTTAAAATQTQTQAVTTAAVPSAACSVVRIVAAQNDRGGAERGSDGGREQEDGGKGLGDAAPQPLDALLLDDPDAPPFAKVALRRFYEHAHPHIHHRHAMHAGATRRGEGRGRDAAAANAHAATATIGAAGAGAGAALDAETSPCLKQAPCRNGAVSCGVSKAAVQHDCNVYSTTPEARCLNRSTANLPSAPPLSPVLVSQSSDCKELQQHTEKVVYPHKPYMNPLETTARPRPNAGVVPLTAMEIHLPKVSRVVKQPPCKKATGGRDFSTEL